MTKPEALPVQSEDRAQTEQSAAPHQPDAPRQLRDCPVFPKLRAPRPVPRDLPILTFQECLAWQAARTNALRARRRTTDPSEILTIECDLTALDDDAVAADGLPWDLVRKYAPESAKRAGHAA